ncbi:hypothetical protein MP228_011005 [Amoeboaphelidium protococcarum]|nr:hypothetical protein MP228_011005 [Amoeboaphelidium protococcarum]
MLTSMRSKLLGTQFTRNLLQKRFWHPPPKNYDQQQNGLYPTDIKWTSHTERSPYQRWDDDVHRRNFGEPIHEEFDLQDAFFQGKHDPWGNFMNGIKNMAWIPLFFALFYGGAYLLNQAVETRPPPKRLDPEVQRYLDTKGWERVNKDREYQVVKQFAFDAQVDPTVPIRQRQTDEFGKAVKAQHSH